MSKERFDKLNPTAKGVIQELEKYRHQLLNLCELISDKTPESEVDLMGYLRSEINQLKADLEAANDRIEQLEIWLDWKGFKPSNCIKEVKILTEEINDICMEPDRERGEG